MQTMVRLDLPQHKNGRSIQATVYKVKGFWYIYRTNSYTGLMGLEVVCKCQKLVRQTLRRWKWGR